MSQLILPDEVKKAVHGGHGLGFLVHIEVLLDRLITRVNDEHETDTGEGGHDSSGKVVD